MKAVDLAYQSGKKRQSPRTGFVHGADLLSDTVPFYDNFCFAYALLAQRKAAEILEAKGLLIRLLAFQAEDGNFPISLHDFPKCYDSFMALRIAPLLLRALKGYSSVIGVECKEKMELALKRILSHYKGKSLPPLWKFRYQVCLGHTPEPIVVTPAELWEYWVSQQFLETPICTLYHQGLLLAPALFMAQNHFEPSPHLIEWMCAVTLGEFSPRLQKDHPTQVQLAALEKLEVAPSSNQPFLLSAPFRLFWRDQSLHSLILVADKFEVSPSSITIELPEVFEFPRDDLFEVQFFCDASPDVQIAIASGQGTSFAMNEPIQVRTASFVCTLNFEILRGEGDFCGRIFRSNRPGQVACTGPLQYEAFDWKIGLRTLRRSADCAIAVTYSIAPTA